MKKVKPYINIILFIIILICIDQIIKIAIPKEEITIIPDILKITYTQNTGVAFGIGSGSIIQIILINILILAFAIRFLIVQFKKSSKTTKISLCLIIAGGISNLLNRIFIGFVTDYISVLKFPVFNLADIFIVCGWIIFLINTMIYVAKNKEGI